MGLNLKLQFKTKEEIDENNFVSLDYDFNEATDRFGPLEHLGGNKYEIKCSNRYYGPGYQRGNFPEIYMALLWLQMRLPEVIILYGDEWAEEEGEFRVYDEEFKKLLLGMWTKSGNQDYTSYFQSIIPSGDTRVCPKHYTRPLSWTSVSLTEIEYKCAACEFTEKVYRTPN